MNRSDLKDVKNWVLVDVKNFAVHRFYTFEEALKSPIQGHLMTESFYKTEYREVFKLDTN